MSSTRDGKMDLKDELPYLSKRENSSWNNRNWKPEGFLELGELERKYGSDIRVVFPGSIDEHTAARLAMALSEGRPLVYLPNAMNKGDASDPTCFCHLYCGEESDSLLEAIATTETKFLSYDFACLGDDITPVGEILDHGQYNKSEYREWHHGPIILNDQDRSPTMIYARKEFVRGSKSVSELTEKIRANCPEEQIRRFEEVLTKV
ncbi:hypothetical protein CMI48_02730 [Candidatus Pacearchaeota archaeon]|nr:hypothetical protein [Candidatus Pacearchaeota archaeon]|tara:strand:- start:3190 stop:3807 length:618 start_codon:yes stop_codon:yes gene_type:complete